MQMQRNLQKLILFLMTLGNSLYSMFVPIYYLNHGISFNRIVFYLMVFCLGGVSASIVSNIIMHKKGVKIFIVLRGILEPLIVLIIRFYPVLRYPIELQGFASGFIGFSYWVSMDTVTLKTTEPKKRGNQQGSIYASMWLSTIIAPFVGGFLITWFNYPVLFITSLLLVLIGGLLSFKLKLNVPVKKKIVWFSKLKGNLPKHMWLVFLRGMTFVITAFIFPIYIFELSKQELVVGSFGTFLGIIALISTSASGFLIDKYNKKNVLMSFILLQSLSWILFGVLNLPYAFILIVSLFYNAINVPYNTIFFDDIENKDAVTLIAERMLMFCIGAIIFLGFAFVFDYKLLFILLGAITPLSVLFVRKLKI